jgi:SapC protein
MTRHVLLNNVEHRGLRVITRHGADLGDNVMYAPTFPAEFRNIQAHYPIVFARLADGKFQPLAMFGFREKQNLFLVGDSWDAHYLPLLIDRVPFLIGNGPNGKVLHIDLDNPRVSRTEGQPLFLEHGGNSPFLDHVSRVMGTIDEGLEATPAFIAALEEHNLLESFALDIQFRDGAQFRFAGFHAIHEERLAKLDAAALGKLHARGHLQCIYMVMASLSNIRGLIERANKLNAGDR